MRTRTHFETTPLQYWQQCPRSTHHLALSQTRLSVRMGSARWGRGVGRGKTYGSSTSAGESSSALAAYVYSSGSSSKCRIITTARRQFSAREKSVDQVNSA